MVTYPSAGDDDERRLESLLRQWGATESEMATARAGRAYGALALDLTLRGGRPPSTLADVAAAMGARPEDLARFWRALGLSSDSPESTQVPAAFADVLPVLATTADELMAADVWLGIARVIGAGTARLAEAVVDSFRMGMEVPELAAGVSYSDVVQSYVALTRDSLPALEQLVAVALRAHLVRVAAGAWAPDVDSSAARRTLTVGFADLVGYTALSRTLPPAQLAALLGRFEEAVADVLSAYGGRLVKLIGDGAMFAVDRPESACAVALQLSERLADSHTSPPVRIGLAHGAVLTLFGDYFGEVVNLAARLVALAHPGTVVVSAEVAAAAGASYVVEQLPPAALKGFGAPETVFRLTAAGK